LDPILGAILLGLIQGITEFLPISSSGHLTLAQHFIEVSGDDLAFDLVLHLGTLLPVFVVFRQDILQMLRDPFIGTGPFLERPGVRWLYLVGVATIPTGIIGLLLEDLFESMFSGYLSLAWQFSITALVLHYTARTQAGSRQVESLTARDALIVGIAQGIAILPAISRSGSTIAMAMVLGWNRDLSGRFSFVLSIPAILGACLLKARKIHELDSAVLPVWLAGGLVALISGWISLLFLVRVIRAGNFSRFAWYCWGMAIISLALALL
jgi:undecaprenyl-diphosphatase